MPPLDVPAPTVTSLVDATSEFGQFFAWSPDGSAILVAGAAEMYVIRPDGSGRTPFPVEGVTNPLFPDWIV